MTSIINLKNVTKDYKNNVGVFDVTLNLNENEVFGFIGPNGAGKTTVIRQIVGFIKPDSGEVLLDNVIPWKNGNKVMDKVGYLAGEVTIPEYMTGLAYLKLMSKLKKNVDWNYVEKLIAYFELDPKRKIKKMSKGMKQKVGIINAFMNKPKILVLDEPTSGLDPLMQEKFNQLIANAKKEGATIFISSHIFGEIESTCDRVAFIKKGKIISEVKIEDLKHNNDKTYELIFNSLSELLAFTKNSTYEIVSQSDKNNKVIVSVPSKKVNAFLAEVVKYSPASFHEQAFNLESHFIDLYKDEVGFND